jgi:hypothetical protein
VTPLFEVVVGAEDFCQALFPQPSLPDGDQPAWIFVGQGAEQNGIYDAEDGGGGSDSEGQRDYGNGGQAWLLTQEARGESKILPAFFQPSECPCVAAGFA